MTFDYSGYTLKFIQKKLSRDSSTHLRTLVYKFYSPVITYNYVLHTDYYEESVFAIKFYAKKDKHIDYRYSRLTNKGDVGNILITCLEVIPLLLKDYPDASFGFIGSGNIDKKSQTVENIQNNQRFRVYRKIVELKTGFQTFEHFEYKM